MKGRRIVAILVVVVLLCMLLSDSSRDTENAGVTFPVLTDMVLDSGRLGIDACVNILQALTASGGLSASRNDFRFS